MEARKGRRESVFSRALRIMNPRLCVGDVIIFVLNDAVQYAYVITHEYRAWKTNAYCVSKYSQGSSRVEFNTDLSIYRDAGWAIEKQEDGIYLAT